MEDRPKRTRRKRGSVPLKGMTVKLLPETLDAAEILGGSTFARGVIEDAVTIPKVHKKYMPKIYRRAAKHSRTPQEELDAILETAEDVEPNG